MQLTDSDKQQLEQLGISEDTLRQQLTQFEIGFPFVRLDRPATPGDGIVQLDQPGASKLAASYDQFFQHLQVAKMVPASGAASRMFKSLHHFLSTPDSETPSNEVLQFVQEIDRFAFTSLLEEQLRSTGKNLQQCLEVKDHKSIVEAVLDVKQLGFGQSPKALIPFHSNGELTRTALEEHFVEAIAYAQNNGGATVIHFTVAEEHLERVKQHVAAVRGRYEAGAGTQMEITYSTQSIATNTVAVDLDNRLYRDQDDKLLFRPAGHGALLSNLEQIRADIVFLKNIDNVAQDWLKPDTVLYKKALAGLLLTLQTQIFEWIKRLRKADLAEGDWDALRNFVTEELGLSATAPEDLAAWIDLLNRPIRVCGMVRNEGEPGGGPFWVREESGAHSLQIVEKAQVQMEDPQQAAMLLKSTHFNPVDLICAFRDVDGNAFPLEDFRDPQTGFITEKSHAGSPIKSMELPGLWNGAMARWITVFVEVPITTFNPVKTVNDLLKSAHQPKVL